jgi:uncharacterized protein
MSEEQTAGRIGWVDLTVEDAPRVRDFYQSVVGWNVEACDMGGYSDFTMLVPATGEPVAGVCHARGVNAGLPPVWMVYFTVDDVDASAARTAELGGEVLVAPKDMGSYGRYAVVRDPAGAVAALFESKRV